MLGFRFSFKIRKEYQNQLEKLFFFNENQWLYYHRIIELVEHYGEPHIVIEGNDININLRKTKTKSLFVSYGPKLAGVFVYEVNRISGTISIIHIALNKDYTYRGIFAKRELLVVMVDYLRDYYVQRNCKIRKFILEYKERTILM